MKKKVLQILVLSLVALGFSGMVQLAMGQARERNDPLGKKLIWSARSQYALTMISRDEMIATVDFVVAHR
jgi:hypothetical protein